MHVISKYGWQSWFGLSKWNIEIAFVSHDNLVEIPDANVYVQRLLNVLLILMCCVLGVDAVSATIYKFFGDTAWQECCGMSIFPILRNS